MDEEALRALAEAASNGDDIAYDMLSDGLWSGSVVLALLDRVKALEEGLSFYADPERYHGPNQGLDRPDKWSEEVGLKAYRLDVTRDHGCIARALLENKHE
jgi:hypothetical protein